MPFRYRVPPSARFKIPSRPSPGNISSMICPSLKTVRFSFIKGFALLLELLWMAWASTSLPVPGSPEISTR